MDLWKKLEKLHFSLYFSKNSKNVDFNFVYEQFICEKLGKQEKQVLRCLSEEKNIYQNFSLKFCHFLSINPK